VKMRLPFDGRILLISPDQDETNETGSRRRGGDGAIKRMASVTDIIAPPERGETQATGARGVRRRWPYRFVLGAAALMLALLMAVTAGFVVFAQRVVSEASVVTDGWSEGIVVLTGGKARVTEGLALLDQGRAGRLLISGVHPETSALDIARATDRRRALFSCCVDLGRTAANTTGNAREAQRWAARRNVKSLIVVTSAYHMPRSMLEMRALLPGVQLRPHAVKADQLATWYRDPATVQLMVLEYAKFLAASARLSVMGAEPDLAAFAEVDRGRQTTAH